jgi:hypothetical protein
MDDNHNINIDDMPFIYTNDGHVLSELSYHPKKGMSGENYVITGRALRKDCGRYIFLSWRLDGLTQNPLFRRMAWEPIDTPQYDIAHKSLSIIHEKLLTMDVLAPTDREHLAKLTLPKAG